MHSALDVGQTSCTGLAHRLELHAWVSGTHNEQRDQLLSPTHTHLTVQTALPHPWIDSDKIMANQIIDEIIVLTPPHVPHSPHLHPPPRKWVVQYPPQWYKVGQSTPVSSGTHTSLEPSTRPGPTTTYNYNFCPAVSSLQSPTSTLDSNSEHSVLGLYLLGLCNSEGL